jgi:hypothetical protein
VPTLQHQSTLFRAVPLFGDQDVHILPLPSRRFTLFASSRPSAALNRNRHLRLLRSHPWDLTATDSIGDRRPTTGASHILSLCYHNCSMSLGINFTHESLVCMRHLARRSLSIDIKVSTGISHVDFDCLCSINITACSCALGDSPPQ